MVVTKALRRDEVTKGVSVVMAEKRAKDPVLGSPI